MIRIALNDAQAITLALDILLNEDVVRAFRHDATGCNLNGLAAPQRSSERLARRRGPDDVEGGAVPSVPDADGITIHC